MNTNDLFEFTYGFVDVRAKLPCQSGSWPAIWSLFADDKADWPEGGEIDIMEFTGAKSNIVQASTHTKDYNHISKTQFTAFSEIKNACGEFHNYQLNWTPQSIRIGIDGKNYMHHDNDNSGDFGKWPFSKPQFLILNLAVGGAYVGKDKLDDNSFPWQMQIDYVRVYQPK